MIFFTLLPNLIPLYLLIAIGYLAGRFYDVDRTTLANLAVFIMMPVMVFSFVATLDLHLEYALLPVVMYGIQTIVAFGSFWLAGRIYDDTTPNLLAMCASMGNFGYFGLPVILLMFPPEWIGVYMFLLLGNILFEATVGYYIAARGHFDVRQSLRKLAKFPSIYAVVLGILVNLSGFQLPDVFFTYRDYFKGAYVIVGMMIIGTALSQVNKLVLGPRFLAMVFLGKFVAWPVLAFLTVTLDSLFTQWFEPEVHQLLLVLSTVPPAANIAAFAAQLNLTPAKAATTVLIGTVFALFYMPALFAILQIDIMP